MTERTDVSCVTLMNDPALNDALAALMDDPQRRARMGALGRRYAEQYADRNVVCAAIWRALNDAPQQGQARACEPA